MASGVGILAIVCGGRFAVFEYLETDSADRVKETLALVEQFDKQPIYDARLRIDKTWITQGERAKKCARKKGALEKETTLGTTNEVRGLNPTACYCPPLMLSKYDSFPVKDVMPFAVRIQL